MAMANRIDDEGYELEYLGDCMTNDTPDSVHIQIVENRYLWSYAQEAALMVISEQGPDRIWRLIHDPIRRAKRIAAHYAKLYFDSAEKSDQKIQFYWPALAAFVVKDIVGGFLFSHERIFCEKGVGYWLTSSPARLATGVNAYEHATRVYAALAKGNLWLFMDIYPWYWFFQEYCIRKDGRLHDALARSAVDDRRTSRLQNQSKQATGELPFGRNWFARQQARSNPDPVYESALQAYTNSGSWTSPPNIYAANFVVKRDIAKEDKGYYLPSTKPKNYWFEFDNPCLILESHLQEMKRMAADREALDSLDDIAEFTVTDSVRQAYEELIAEKDQQTKADREGQQFKELTEIANHEQLNVLQDLIYRDAELANSMDLNHQASRISEVLSPRYRVVYSADFQTEDERLQTVFDDELDTVDSAKGMVNMLFSDSFDVPRKKLSDPDDRMKYVGDIARDFHGLMSRDRAYMEAELRKIMRLLDA